MVAAAIGSDSKSSLSSPHGRSSAMSTTSRRITRPAVVTPQSRPPVLIEITETTARVGIVGVDATPKHVFPLQTVTPPFFSSSGPLLHDPASVWYRYLAPIIKTCYQRLIGFGAKERKAIVIFRGFDDQTLPRSIEDALLAVFLKEIGVPAVNLQCGSLSMVPYSLPMLSHMLVIFVGLNEASCQVHAAGENLPFTFQSVPLERAKINEEDGFKSTFLDLNNPNSVMTALLKTLEACPRTVRKFVIANMVFCGTGLFHQPYIPLVIAKQLKATLAAAAAADKSRSKLEVNPEGSEPPSGEDGNNNIQVVIPANLKSLAGLESSVGLVRAKVRPDLLAWTGTNQWASHWHGQDPMLEKWKWHSDWQPRN